MKVRAADEAVVVAPPLRAARAPFPALVLPAGMENCLRAAVKALPAKVQKRLGKRLELRVRKLDSGDARVFLEGALTVPACVQEWADVAVQGRPVGAWEKVKVRL